MQYLTPEMYLDSPVGIGAKHELEKMASNPTYNTLALFDSGAGHKLNFIERHLGYLTRHPSTNIDAYISNLKIMTRISR